MAGAGANGEVGFGGGAFARHRDGFSDLDVRGEAASSGPRTNRWPGRPAWPPVTGREQPRDHCCCRAEVVGAGGMEKVMLVYIISSHV